MWGGLVQRAYVGPCSMPSKFLHPFLYLVLLLFLSQHGQIVWLWKIYVFKMLVIVFDDKRSGCECQHGKMCRQANKTESNPSLLFGFWNAPFFYCCFSFSICSLSIYKQKPCMVGSNIGNIKTLLLMLFHNSKEVNRLYMEINDGCYNQMLYWWLHLGFLEVLIMCKFWYEPLYSGCSYYCKEIWSLLFFSSLFVESGGKMK